jgi:DNA ligase-1
MRPKPGIAYPAVDAPGAKPPYSRDGKTYHPGADLMLADRYVPGMRLGPRLLEDIDGLRQPPVGWWASEKMDGLRALWNGASLVTRASPGKDPKAFSSAPAWFVAALPPGFALDGELWMGRGKFHEVAGISNAKEPDELKWRRVRYAVFDAPAVAGGLEARLGAARAAVLGSRRRWSKSAAAKRVYPVAVVALKAVRDDAHLDAMMRETVAKGGEGLVLRSPGGPYVPRRSKHMLKMKAAEDTEMVVTGHQAGAGRHAGAMGALVGEELDANGKKTGLRVVVGTGFTDAQRRDHLALYPVGTVVSVAFMERTPAGALRMPSFRGVREDKAVLKP